MTATPDVGSCQTCPAGYYCPLASSTPTDCPRGSYCVAGSFKPEPCPIGRYGNTSCKSAVLYDLSQNFVHIFLWFTGVETWFMLLCWQYWRPWLNALCVTLAGTVMPPGSYSPGLPVTLDISVIQEPPPLLLLMVWQESSVPEEDSVSQVRVKSINSSRKYLHTCVLGNHLTVYWISYHTSLNLKNFIKMSDRLI